MKTGTLDPQIAVALIAFGGENPGSCIKDAAVGDSVVTDEPLFPNLSNEEIDQAFCGIAIPEAGVILG